MIYQPRNVQPSGVSIDGLLDNTFTMEIQTNSYVSAYQLLIVDFNNNEIYTGSKTTLTNYAYNGDTLEIPVNASTVALSNGTNYKWRVRLYQPTADMLITYGLVQSTSTTTTIYLQPNINIKAGMAITINSQTKTISSYNSDTGVAVVSSAFSSAPVVGTQYKIYSDFIETVPDYIVYARRTPAVAISNVPSSLTLKYHTFQGTYTQSDNVAIVYHQFDLYTRNDDGTISLVASSDKVYSANLSYTYDSFRTGNKYLIQMTVENDMGIISTTDMYEFTVSYDIVEYLQQPLASFDDKNNAVKVSWVTPVENEATSFRSDAATGIIEDNNNTYTQATFEPGQSIGEGDVVQITNSDCELVIDGRSTQEVRYGKNKFEFIIPNQTVNGLQIVNNYDGSITLNGTTTDTVSMQFSKTMDNLTAGDYYLSFNPTGSVSATFTRIVYGRQNNVTAVELTSTTSDEKSFSVSTDYTYYYLWLYIKSGITFTNYIIKPQLETGNVKTSFEQYGATPTPDIPSRIKNLGYTNLFKPTLITDDGSTIKVNHATVKMDGDTFIFTCKNSTDLYFGQVTDTGGAYRGECGNLIDVSEFTSISYNISNKLFTKNFVTYYDKDLISLRAAQYNTHKGTINLKYAPAGTKYITFRFGRSPATVGEVYETTVQINEGDMVLPHIPYGKYGIETKAVGMNLLDMLDGTYSSNGITAVVNNGTITLNGTATDTAFVGITTNSYYNIVDGEKFTVSAINPVADSNVSIRINDKAIYDTRLNTINRVATYTKESENPLIGNKLQIRVQSGATLVNYIIKPMLKKGLPAEYQSYRANSKLLVLNEPLRSLPNGVKDIAYIRNGKLYVDRKIGSVVLDGRETLNYINNYDSEIYRFNITSLNNKANCKILSNLFSQIDYDTTKEGIYIHITNANDISFFIDSSRLSDVSTTVKALESFKLWLSEHNTQVDYELATPITEEIGNSAIPYVDGINYMYISSNIDTTFSLVYPHKTITGNSYDYTEFNPPGVKQTGTIKSYNAITGVGTLMAQYPFTYIPMQGDPYAVVSNIYNVSGFSYLYNTPYNTVNSLYTHGYTATWATPDGLCVLPDDFNITLQFSPDGNFFYDQNGVYQEVVDLITTETDGASGDGEFTIKIDKNKLIFVQNPDISLELPFYTNTSQVFVLSSANIAQINNDYIWDDTATWTDTYTWVEGGTSLERVCNHWWKVQITNTGIKIEEIFPTT